jgi:hypothetical protein
MTMGKLPTKVDLTEKEGLMANSGWLGKPGVSAHGTNCAAQNNRFGCQSATLKGVMSRTQGAVLFAAIATLFSPSSDGQEKTFAVRGSVVLRDQPFGEP